MVRWGWNRWLWLFAILMLVLNSMLLLKYYHTIFACKKSILDVRRVEQEKFDWKLQNSEMNLIVGYQNNGLKIANLQLRDTNEHIIEINNLFTDKTGYIFVCRFSEFFCETCNLYIIAKAKRFSKDIGMENVMFFGNYLECRSLNFMKSQYGLDRQNLFNVSIEMPIEEIGFPYFFILNAQLYVSHIFVPDESHPELTKQYLNIIKERFFNVDN